jgi:hypothetical protein
MTLAAILSIAFFILSGSGAAHPGLESPPGLRQAATQDQNNPPSARPTPAPTSPATAPQSQNPPSPAKKRSQRKKTSTPDCSTSPAPLKSPDNNPDGTAASTNSTGAAPSHPATPPPNNNNSTTKPCPPPKVVVKDGGSDAPTIALTHGTSEQQASEQRFTTEQLQTATEENLKKLAGRQLTASQQEIVTQIKQFMEQAKSAVADGDLERGHSLAMKAQLLSEELLKP